MDAAAFEQVYGAFGDFHAYFAPLFGRRETRDHSRHYLQALLVQSGERRNAENLSEAVPASARVMQRFLTESPWDDDAVIGRLQEYLGPRLGHPEGVWVLDGSDFPKQGQEVRGSGPSVLRETGQSGQLPGRNVPGLCQPVGTGPGGQAIERPRQLAPSRSPRAPLAVSYPAISLTTASVGRQRCPRKRLQIALQLPAYPNSSPDHRACNSLTPLRPSSRRIYVSTGGFGLIGPDGGALRGTVAGSLPTLHGGIVEGAADMGTICP